MIKIIFYTDGSAHPNPGPGGWGVVIFNNNGKFIDCKSEQSKKQVTNNQMELEAIYYSLLEIIENYNKCDNFIVTDSNYCYNIVTDWIFRWQANDWIKSDKKPPENLALIQEIYNCLTKVESTWFRLVKGHSESQGNNLADKLATGKMTCKQLKEQIKIELEMKKNE